MGVIHGEVTVVWNVELSYLHPGKRIMIINIIQVDSTPFLIISTEVLLTKTKKLIKISNCSTVCCVDQV